MLPTEEKAFLRSGPAGDIEVLMRESAAPIGVTAIICHPHPLHGGTMQNKVVTILEKTLHDAGCRTIRFNFRGVGKSAGVYDNGYGETEDVLAIADWVKKEYPNDNLWLAGFSFGGFVAARAAIPLSVKQLITVAPQASRFTPETLPTIPFPWLIIQGDADDVVPPQELYDWVETIAPKPTVVRLPKAGHFFHGQLSELRKAVEAYLLSQKS